MNRNHTVEAGNYINEIHAWQAHEGSTDATHLASGLMAVTESNLAVAQQLRIQNLINLGQLELADRILNDTLTEAERDKKDQIRQREDNARPF